MQFLNSGSPDRNPGLAARRGSLSAAEIAPTGMYFVGWTGDGGVLSVYRKSPTAPVEISGNGAL